MKLTKYEHALFTVENNGQILVIDPGNMSPSFVVPPGVVGIVVTHAHRDHFNPELISKIAQKNPTVVIFGDAAVTSQIQDFKTITVAAGDSRTIGNFTLKFFGGQHTPIHDSLSAGTNLGVLINNTIYYPGDSFSRPDKPVDMLALPISGPWLKTGEAIDFLLAVKPNRVFPTHEALNSDTSLDMYHTMLGRFSDQIKADYIPLTPGQPVEL